LLSSVIQFHPNFSANSRYTRTEPRSQKQVRVTGRQLSPAVVAAAAGWLSSVHAAAAVPAAGGDLLVRKQETRQQAALLDDAAELAMASTSSASV